MAEIKTFQELQDLFIKPEKTKAGICFGNPPNLPSFEEAKIVVYGVCFDDTATFGKGSERGPEAIRHTSARQIETYLIQENVDIYEKTPVFDLGDLKIKKSLTKKEREILFDESASENEKKKVIEKLKSILEQFNVLKDITNFIQEKGKIPLMLGGEHTLSYWPLCALADKDLVVIYFDAHRDAKDEYIGIKLCHTTSVYHFLIENKNKHKINFIQIGIRQCDKKEQEFAGKIGIKTFYPVDVKTRLKDVMDYINKITKNRNVYLTFDIDVLDICYTPCTGTPEPFGLSPSDVFGIIKAIDKSARLAGIDFMEVAAKNDDFREGTIATQLLLRLFAREFVKN